MKLKLIALLLLFITSCSPTQNATTYAPGVGDLWRLTVEGQTFDFQIEKITQVLENYTFMNSSPAGKAGAFLITPPLPTRAYVAFIAKTRPGSQPIIATELPQQEGITCAVEYDPTVRKITGNYVNGKFRLSSIYVENDGACTLERL